MHSESALKRAIRPILENYGSLNMTELRQVLKTEIPLDEGDRKPSSTRRGEISIDQNIRNIVSHTKGELHYFPEGFYLDKSKKPARFMLSIGTGSKLKPIDAKEIKRRKATAQKFKSLQRKMSKTDWDELNQRRTKLGLQGELFVLEKEKEGLSDELKNKVIHTSQLGDRYGYDITSVDSLGNEKYIEVKTTEYKISEPFYISQNELNFIKLHKTNSFIYRVYEFSTDTNTGELLIISAKDLLNKSKYRINPYTYRVTKV